jgi:hypothetical protein
MPAAGVVTILAVLLIVVALVVFLIPTILTLRQISSALDDAIEGVGGLVEKTVPVGSVVNTINANLDAAVDALEGLLVKKAGMGDAVGLIEGLYPGSAPYGLRNFPESRTITPRRISEVYTKGTLTLARLGREAPIAVASPEGPAIRDTVYASLSARHLYPEVRQSRPPKLARSPIIGTASPVQYEPSLSPGVRAHMPATTHTGGVRDPAPSTAAGFSTWAIPRAVRPSAGGGGEPQPAPAAPVAPSPGVPAAEDPPPKRSLTDRINWRRP